MVSFFLLLLLFFDSYSIKIEANPEKFTRRWFNLLQYAEAGGRDQIKKTWKDLTDFIHLEVFISYFIV